VRGRQGGWQELVCAGGARASRSDASSDVSGRLAVSREGGRQKGSDARDGGERSGRAGGSSSSSTAGLPLDGEDLNFDFRCKDL
jgi:hypothetical protein